MYADSKHTKRLLCLLPGIFFWVRMAYELRLASYGLETVSYSLHVLMHTLLVVAHSIIV